MIGGEQAAAIGPGMAPTARARAAIPRGWRHALILVALLIGIGGRIAYGWGAPLWFDETFSAVIASQPSVEGLVHWCLSELTGPAYYMPLWLWVKIAGAGDWALRAPSLACAIAAPLLILWRGHDDRDVRLFWAVLCLLWLPAFPVGWEARPYPQIFLLGAMQVMLFARLIAAPATPRALAWTSVSALLVLTHYHGAIISGVQGLIYLIRHRRAAIATWPALIALVPMVAWVVLHAPLLIAFSRAHDAAYSGLPIAAIAQIPAFLFGVPLHGALVIAVVLAATYLRRREARFTLATLDPATLAALASALSIALMLVLAFLRPGFAPRYLAPAMPGLLLGVALWMRWMLRVDAKPVVLVLAILLLAALGVLRSSLVEPDRDPRHIFNLQTASTWLAPTRPHRLLMFWDGPVGALTPVDRIDAISGFFLRRAGEPVVVTVLRAGAADDPNAALARAMARAPDAALLWIANDVLPARRRPQLKLLGRDRLCHDFGADAVTVVACRPR